MDAGFTFSTAVVILFFISLSAGKHLPPPEVNIPRLPDPFNMNATAPPQYQPVLLAQPPPPPASIQAAPQNMHVVIHGSVLCSEALGGDHGLGGVLVEMVCPLRVFRGITATDGRFTFDFHVPRAWRSFPRRCHVFVLRFMLPPTCNVPTSSLLSHIPQVRPSSVDEVVYWVPYFVYRRRYE